MSHRPNPYVAAPGLMQQWIASAQAVTAEGLEHSLKELVKIRASQINGCVVCLDMHIREALQAGESQARIDMLNAWEESELYTCADPYLSVILSVLGDGDVHGWHFDTNDFAISLSLQEAEAGGEFVFAPYLRGEDDENYPAVRDVFAGSAAQLVRSKLQPGTLTLFRGRQSPHYVAEVKGPRQRLMAIFSYHHKPGLTWPESTIQARCPRQRWCGVSMPPGFALSEHALTAWLGRPGTIRPVSASRWLDVERPTILVSAGSVTVTRSTSTAWPSPCSVSSRMAVGPAACATASSYQPPRLTLCSWPRTATAF